MTTKDNPLWSPVIAGLSPYVPGEQPKVADLIKLNTNENPYPPSPRALEAIREATASGLRLYPDPDSSALKTAIAENYGVSPAEVFVGNGSDEVLAHAFFGLLQHPQPILFPDITYSFYPVYCDLYGIQRTLVPLDESFRIRINDYLRPNGGIVLPNPNAPTGCALPLPEIRRLLEANRGSVVIVDEAYVDFGTESAVGLVREFPQLLVIHTLSKSRSFAGLRVGYAIGNPSLIEALIRVKDCFNSYPIDRLALVGAVAAIRDTAYFESTCAKVIATRERLVPELEKLGFEVLPSGANFVFARHPQHEGAALQAKLRERKIIVRHFNKPRIDRFLRITIGTEDECRALVDALRDIVG